MRLRCNSLSITTRVSLLVNQIDVRSILHGQVSLAAAVNQAYVIHEAIGALFFNSLPGFDSCGE